MLLRSARDSPGKVQRPLTDTTETVRLRIAIRGAVQGVGFRPFIFRLAGRWELRGWVNNSNQGVFIEVEGKRE